MKETQVPGADAFLYLELQILNRRRLAKGTFFIESGGVRDAPHDPMNCSIIGIISSSNRSILGSLHGLKPGCIIIHADLRRDPTGKPILAKESYVDVVSDIQIDQY